MSKRTDKNDVGEKPSDAVNFCFMIDPLSCCVRMAFRKESLCKAF